MAKRQPIRRFAPTKKKLHCKNRHCKNREHKNRQKTIIIDQLPNITRKNERTIPYPPKCHVCDIGLYFSILRTVTVVYIHLRSIYGTCHQCFGGSRPQNARQNIYRRNERIIFIKSPPSFAKCPALKQQADGVARTTQCTEE